MPRQSVWNNRFSQDLEALRADVTRTHRLLFPQSWEPKLPEWAASMNEIVLDWLDERGLVKDAATRRLVENERADLYGGYSFGWAGFERCLAVTKGLVLWILFDDVVTESDGGYWQRHGLSVQDYTEAMRGGALSPRADPFLRAWWELSHASFPSMSQCWRDRFAALFAGWLESTRRERETYAPLLVDGRLPDLDTYVNIRSQTIGVRPTLPYIELASGFELPEGVRCCAPVDALHEIGSRLVLVANDIFSLEKDLESNWPNAVTVMARQYDLSLLDALEHAVRIHNAHVAAFVEIERGLPMLGPEATSLVKQYLESIHFMIRGFAEFELRAERYRWTNQLAEDRFRHRVTIASISDE